MSLARASAAALQLALLLVVLGCTTSPAARSDASGAPEAMGDDVLPVADYVGDPPLAMVRIAPDGESVLGVTSREGTRVLIQKPLRSNDLRLLAKYEAPERVVREVGWAGPGVAAVVLEDLRATAEGGPTSMRFEGFRVERWRAIRIEDGFAFALPPGSPQREAVLHWLPEDPESVLVTQWEPGDAGASVRRARVRDGLGPTVTPPIGGALRWFADGAGRVRAAQVRDPEGLTETVYARSDATSALEPLVAADLVEESELAFAGFAPDPQRIYVTALGDAGRRVLYPYDLARHARGAQVAGDPEADVGSLIYEPGSDRLRAVAIGQRRPALDILDPEWAREEASIDATFPGTLHRVVSVDQTGRMAILEVSADTRPPEYYVYDRVARQMDFLSAAHPRLSPEHLAPMRAVHYTSRDGLVVPAYLTIPNGVAPHGLPAVVVLRDDPGEEDLWGWDATAQLLANRGFAVFAPDLRVSSGARAGGARDDRDAGAALQGDLADGAAWLVSEGIADPDRIALYGTGAGGDAALRALLEQPGRFRAAASYGAVTDWLALFDAPTRSASGALEPPVPGDTARGRARLAEISPARHASQIEGAVLLGHGDLDARVPAAQARALADALEQAGGKVELQVYRGEAQEFANERHRVDFYERLVAFLERNLRERSPL